MAATCRYYGITRQCFYTWKRRFDEEGLDGLRDRSHRPHHSPLATSTDVVGKIVYLRQHYHLGPRRISMYLKRYHDITISNSGVWRILKRLELNRLPASQRHKTHDRRWKRYEKPHPGHQVQIDVKFIEPLAAARAKRYYQYTAIDDCTRLRVLRIYPRNNQATAIQFLDHVLEKLPFQVESIQTDNGSEFQSNFHWHVSTATSATSTSSRPPLDSTAKSSDPTASTPRVYRMLDHGVVIDDANIFNDKLQEWEDFYNFHRPHGSLDGQTPYERLRQKTNPTRA